jgi:glutathione S-transferase
MPDILLHHIPGAWRLSSISPFCLKLETYLKMAGHDFQVVLDGNPSAAPKKKLPWIEYKGQKIGDSTLIIDYLTRQTGVDLNAGLSVRQRANARALRCLLEDHLYWVMVYDRWLVDQNWAWFKDVVLGSIPAPIRTVMQPLIRRQVKKQLAAQGIGRHSREEIHQMGIDDINAVADFLNDKAFMLGEEPSQVDASAYGQLANILQAPIETPVKEAGIKQKNLLSYCARMQNRFYPE